ncbi:protein BTG3-like [Clupea harengus]|uniref:Protein BTG3-like n=1 Tax=Clupea harengus TaxID=7950 RepID=A0A6P8F9F3_CLUHA|nr:protein BTG3-like [Clupea harengus]
MKREIAAVVFFLKRLIKKTGKVEAEKVEVFVERLMLALQDKYKGHWYAESPSKGQAFRCIRMDSSQREDPELRRACDESGVQYADLGLPRELTLWVDPGEVVCRYGENKPAFTIANFSGEESTDEVNVTKKVISAVENVFANHHCSPSSDREGGDRGQRHTSIPFNTRRSFQLTKICAPTRLRQPFSGPIHNESVVKLNPL